MNYIKEVLKKKWVVHIISLLMLLYFSNSFVSYHFYLNFIPLYTRLFMFIIVLLIITWYNRIILKYTILYFLLGLAVYVYSYNIAELFFFNNKHRVEKNGGNIIFINYGLIPTLFDGGNIDSTVRMNGLNGAICYFNIQNYSWKCSD